MIPGLTDHELPAIISAVAKAGAIAAGYVPLRLPYGVAPLFDEWLTLHRPLQKEKILNRIRDIRGGRLVRVGIPLFRGLLFHTGRLHRGLLSVELQRICGTDSDRRPGFLPPQADR